MNTITRSVFLITAVVMVGCGHKSSKIEHSELSKQLDELVEGYYQSQEFSGAVLVADQGRVLLSKGYGYTKLDSTQQIDEASVFEIASLSKQFTAMLVMMMKAEGKLNFDDPITKYFPKLPYQDITIKHLLSHTSGLSEGLFFRWASQNMDPRETYTNRYILENYLEKENSATVFPPGAQWEYSNVGYFLLPLILEEVSGKDYITLLQERIFIPLGMGNTGIASEAYKGTEMETYVFGRIYNQQQSGFNSSFGLAWSDSIYGGVGILSTITDLYKWDRALYSDELIQQDELQAAFEPVTITSDSTKHYGFGWFVKENNIINGKDIGKSVDHYGLWPGYESSIVRYIDADKTIIILANQAPSAKDKLLSEISKMLFQ